MQRRFITLSAAVLVAAAAVLPAAADIDVPTDGVGTVVGMAWDESGERLWMAGDDANDGVLVGIEADGEQSRITWEGDNLQSVQALAIHDGLMYVGDIGNADGNRSDFTVYRFSNLQAGAKKYRSYVFDYPDDAVDFQAMMVSGKGRIYFVSAGENPGIYRAPKNPRRQGNNQVQRVADAPQAVTDGVFLPDGKTMVLRAADGIHVVDAFTFETKAIETYATQIQAESITAKDDETLLIGRSGTLREAAVPTSNITSTPSPSAAVSPSATSSPAPSASGSATPSTSASAEPAPSIPDTQRQPRSTSTTIALVMAGIVAITAGLITFFSRP